MKFIKTFFLIFITLTPAFLEAQIRISGKVLGENREAIPFAAVSIHALIDSSIVSGTTSDMNGDFWIEMAVSGEYLLQIRFLSFENKWQKIKVSNKAISLGEIVLKTSAKELEELEIVGQQSTMTFNLDKRVFNVGSDLSNAGGSAVEILENVPSITLDVDGNIALRGSSNARILIDGQPSAMVGSGNMDALRLIQADMIEKVEIITNPSARYEAEGEAGIINIVLKKDKKDNFNGSIEATTGYPDNHGFSYNLNYRKSKLNLFSSFGINYRRNPGRGESSTQFTNNGVNTYLNSTREQDRGGLGATFRLGADYNFNEYNQLTVSGVFQYSDNRNNSLVTYEDLNALKEIIELSAREDLEREIKNVYEVNVNYLKTFKEKDRKLLFDFRYLNRIDGENSNITQTSNVAQDFLQRVSNQEDQINYIAQLDYVHPLNNQQVIETGLRTSIRQINNSFLVENKDEAGNYTPFGPFDNTFLFDENVHAAYLIYGNTMGAFSVQAGLRGELSDITSELVNTNEINKQLYFNLFPSAHLSYEIDNLNTLQLSYSRRISRPRFWHLLPFYGYSDNRNFFTGNPNLQPEYTDAYEFGYLRYFEKGNILSSAYYRHRTGVVERIIIADSIGFTRRFPINLATQNAFGFEFAANYTPSKKLNINANLNFFRAITSGTYEGSNLFSDTYTWNGRISGRYTIKKGIDFQIATNYQAPEIIPQGKQLAIYAIDMGCAVDVIKGKGTVTFNVRDLLNSRINRRVIDGLDIYGETSFQRRVRAFTLSFVYRINQKKLQKKPFNGNGDLGDD